MNQKFRVSFLIQTAVYLLLGLVMVLWPAVSQRVILSIAAIGLIGYGVFRIVSNIKQGSFFTLSFGYLPGVLALPVGVIMLVKLNAVLALFGAIAGVFMIASALTKFQFAVALRHSNVNLWRASLIMAAVILVAGIVLLFDPLLSITALTILVGIFFLVNAISNFVVLYFVSRLPESYNQPW